MVTRFIKFCKRDDANAAIEAGFLFPVMVAILCGMIDMGVALITNLKVTTATQIVSDLLARDKTVNDAQIDDAINAGRLALFPYDTDSYGVDIVGIQYVGTGLVPTVRWRETRNMDENPAVIERSAGLGLQNEGVIVVTVEYFFEPYFTGFMLNNIRMQEESYVRGRKGLFVQRE